MRKFILLMFIANMLILTACADNAIALIEEARQEQEIEENALEIEAVPETEAPIIEPSNTDIPTEPLTYPYLDKDGNGDFNAAPREVVYSLNIYMGETPFENEEQLPYSSYRFSTAKGLLLCLQVNSTTMHPNAMVLAGAASDPEAVSAVQTQAARLFRMVNENTTATQAQKFLEAMGAISAERESLPQEPIIKYSETMTYEVGVYGNFYYITVSAQPAKAITVNYEAIFAPKAPEPTPTPVPMEETTDLASASMGGLDVVVRNARGGVTKNGTPYIGIDLTVTNNNIIPSSLANCCFIEAEQNDMQMEELTFVSQTHTTETLIDSGATVEMELFFKCNAEDYTGITLLLKTLMGSSEEQIFITF